MNVHASCLATPIRLTTQSRSWWQERPLWHVRGSPKWSWTQDQYLFNNAFTPPVSPDGMPLSEHASFLPLENSFALDADDQKSQDPRAGASARGKSSWRAATSSSEWIAFGGGVPLVRQHSQGVRGTLSNKNPLFPGTTFSALSLVVRRPRPPRVAQSSSVSCRQLSTRWTPRSHEAARMGVRRGHARLTPPNDESPRGARPPDALACMHSWTQRFSPGILFLIN